MLGRSGQRVLTYLTLLLVERPEKVLEDMRMRLAAPDRWAEELPF